MDEAKTEIVGLVTAAGGEMTYRELYETVSFPTRAIIIDALRSLKADSVAEQHNVFISDPPSVSHTVRLMTGGDA